MTHEPIVPSLIPNTTMFKYINNSGTWLAYEVMPIEGYCLHDKGYDVYENYDMAGHGIGERTLGYVTSGKSCGRNYDFTVTSIIDGYTAFGDKEFFARPISEVSENQIFGSGNDHVTA